ncbi:uncharacterized protein EV420DRAFT_1561967 [Desarmillaria tabescens]|uniref:Uncharacterized protein n=1 Tax=Armillaria tabescens TaxID=1929756 RepID=A0AA39MYF3_ARMTA|nr:uncharacterized protein EV420DRAFT_1561967 [Desarmillaria tabescens]KAK0450470.1 hypothetical protein EV420DRAFT_1561967 [Desarmillaria tabescens]
MSALNASLQVANIVEASGIPYVENLAKLAVAVIELLEKKGKNREDVKELCESINNTVAVIQTLVAKHGERGAAYFKGICSEMIEYLSGMSHDLQDMQGKHRGIKGIFNVNKIQDKIKGYKRRVDDLKMDFLIHTTGDIMLMLTEINYKLAVQETGSQEQPVTIQITIICCVFFVDEHPLLISDYH